MSLESSSDRERIPSVSSVLESLPEGEIKLDVLHLQQEPRHDYSELISEAERHVFTDERALRANYAQKWNSYYGSDRRGQNESIARQFDEALPESVLCDLGGYNGNMESVAASRNASLFINVDKYPGGLRDATPIDATAGTFSRRDYVSPISRTVIVPGIHNVIDVRADMLDFVSRLKDVSTNFTINGIDSDLIPVPEYHRAVAREMLRATKRNGIIFGNSSFSVFENIFNLIQENQELRAEFSVISDGRAAVFRRM